MSKTLLTVSCVVLAVGALVAGRVLGVKPNTTMGHLENITDYGKALAEELGIRHTEVIMTYESPVYAAVHFTAKRDGQLVKETTEASTQPAKQIRVWFMYRTQPMDPFGHAKKRHFFKIMLVPIGSGQSGPREKERIYLAQIHRSLENSSTSWGEKSFIFNRDEPLPVNERINYCHLQDKDNRTGEKVLYSIDFEISDKPVRDSDR